MFGELTGNQLTFECPSLVSLEWISISCQKLYIYIYILLFFLHYIYIYIYIYINEIRKPSMWINILENRMVRQLKRLCSWLTVKCTFLLHVSLLLGSFSSCTLYFARLALFRCCHLCHLPYFTENRDIYTLYIWRFNLRKVNVSEFKFTVFWRIKFFVTWRSCCQ